MCENKCFFRVYRKILFNYYIITLSVYVYTLRYLPFPFFSPHLSSLAFLDLHFLGSSDPATRRPHKKELKIPETMQYNNLGRSGLKVSQLSYGSWVSFGNQLDVKEAKALLQCCRDHGVNFFDNAEVYANGRAEEIMGQAIRELGWRRSDLVISTKIFWGGSGPNDKGLSRKHIVEGTSFSLLLFFFLKIG